MEFTSLTVEATNLLPGQYFYVNFNYTEYRNHFKIFTNGQEILGSTVSMPPPAARTGNSYHDSTGKSLWVVFSGYEGPGFGNTQVSLFFFSLVHRDFATFQ